MRTGNLDVKSVRFLFILVETIGIAVGELKCFVSDLSFDPEK